MLLAAFPSKLITWSSTSSSLRRATQRCSASAYFISANSRACAEAPSGTNDQPIANCHVSDNDSKQVLPWLDLAFRNYNYSSNMSRTAGLVCFIYVLHHPERIFTLR